MKENVEKFEELIRNDENVRARLNELAKSYPGDKNDERAFLEATVGKLAQEVGLPFTYEEGVEAHSDKQMSADEIGQIAGGKGFCVGIGGATGGRECETTGHVCEGPGVGY